MGHTAWPTQSPGGLNSKLTRQK